MARMTRAQLAQHQHLEWLCERVTAETVACPPQPYGCGVPAGETCVSGIRARPLQGPPAHGARIRAAAAAAPRASAAEVASTIAPRRPAA